MKVSVICDKSRERLDHLGQLYPEVEKSTDVGRITGDADIDMVAIATPVCTHHSLARTCLEKGKHTFVEKPLASTVERAGFPQGLPVAHTQPRETARRIGKIVMGMAEARIYPEPGLATARFAAERLQPAPSSARSGDRPQNHGQIAPRLTRSRRRGCRGAEVRSEVLLAYGCGLNDSHGAKG